MALLTMDALAVAVPLLTTYYVLRQGLARLGGFGVRDGRSQRRGDGDRGQ